MSQTTENDKNANICILTTSSKKASGKKTSQIGTQSPQTHYSCESLVVATGGLSIPTMGASSFGYELAQQFGHTLVATDASLYHLPFTDKTGELIRALAGISLPVIASNERISFKLPVLFTHRGLSGPAMLQLSNYWHTGETISINLLPEIDMTALLLAHKKSHPKPTDSDGRRGLYTIVAMTSYPKSCLQRYKRTFGTISKIPNLPILKMSD